MRQTVFSVTETIYETVPPNNLVAKIFPQMIPACDITNNENQADRKNEYQKSIPFKAGGISVLYRSLRTL